MAAQFGAGEAVRVLRSRVGDHAFSEATVRATAGASGDLLSAVRQWLGGTGAGTAAVRA
jgi:hypothetical protein